MFTTVAQCQNSIEDKIKQALKDENILNDQKHGGSYIYWISLEGMEKLLRTIFPSLQYRL